MATDAFNQNTGSGQDLIAYNAAWAYAEGDFEVPTGNLGEVRSSEALYCTAGYDADSPSDHQAAIMILTAGQLSNGYYCGGAVRVNTGNNDSYSLSWNGANYYVNKRGSAASTLAGPVTMVGVAGEKGRIEVETSGGNAVIKVYKNTLASPTVFTQYGSDITDSSSPILGAGTYGIFGYGDVAGSGFGGGGWEGLDLGTPPAGGFKAQYYYAMNGVRNV